MKATQAEKRYQSSVLVAQCKFDKDDLNKKNTEAKSENEKVKETATKEKTEL